MHRVVMSLPTATEYATVRRSRTSSDGFPGGKGGPWRV